MRRYSDGQRAPGYLPRTALLDEPALAPGAARQVSNGTGVAIKHR